VVLKGKGSPWLCQLIKTIGTPIFGVRSVLAANIYSRISEEIGNV